MVADDGFGRPYIAVPVVKPFLRLFKRYLYTV